MLAAGGKRRDPGARLVSEWTPVGTLRDPTVRRAAVRAACKGAYRGANARFLEIACCRTQKLALARRRSPPSRRRPRTGGRHAASQGRCLPRPAQRSRAREAVEGAGLPVLPRAGELRRG